MSVREFLAMALHPTGQTEGMGAVDFETWRLSRVLCHGRQWIDLATAPSNARHLRERQPSPARVHRLLDASTRAVWSESSSWPDVDTRTAARLAVYDVLARHGALPPVAR